jgi:hypothetical protein
MSLHRLAIPALLSLAVLSACAGKQAEVSSIGAPEPVGSPRAEPGLGVRPRLERRRLEVRRPQLGGPRGRGRRLARRDRRRQRQRGARAGAPEGAGPRHLLRRAALQLGAQRPVSPRQPGGAPRPCSRCATTTPRACARWRSGRPAATRSAASSQAGIFSDDPARRGRPPRCRARRSAATSTPSARPARATRSASRTTAPSATRSSPRSTGSTSSTAGEADFSKRGYLIDPYTSFVIEGWRTGDDTVAAFRFSDMDSSYAGRTGKSRNIGVIGVAFFHDEEGRTATPRRPRRAAPT